MRVMHTHRLLQLLGSLSTRYTGLGGSPDGPPEKPITAVVQVNLVGVIYTVRLGQYYMMKDKSSDPKAIVFIGSMGG
jgi:NAD(P)-dependent dehydrogenase (short-subunit alcohol dehydrogenase family)